MSSASESDSTALVGEIHTLREEIRQLQAERGRFHTVFEQSPLGHKIIDVDLTILQANAALASMLGFNSPNELIGRRIITFAHPDHQADWTILQKRLWTHKTPSYTLETCLMRCDGSSFWCQVTSILFVDQGRELGYTTLLDTNERKRLEIVHKRLYDAQETILHLVAHDLKAPIANIQLLATLLRTQEPTAPDSTAQQFEREQYLTLIERSCAETHNLLEDILYLGELDAGRLDKQLTEMNTYLAERLRVYQLVAEQKGLALTLQLPPYPVRAALQPQRFNRVIDNLLTNAFKFTPEGGQVQVRLEEHEGRARLLIQDNGMGIPAALQEQVFDKFSAATRVGLRGDASTGLGLFITRQIVELHGGTIKLESEEHQGTTFIIDFK